MAPPKRPPPVQPSGGLGGAGAAVAVIIVILLVLGGIWFFTTGYRQGGETNPLQCIPHQETVYVGYVKTVDGSTYTMTESHRIVNFRYEKGLLLYTLFLTNSSGKTFEYHYVTSWQLQPATIVAGCP